MSIEKIINEAWENKDQVNQKSDQSLKDAVNQIINDLDSGKSRVAEKINGNWIEISAELEVIHDRPSKDWPQEERTLNLWGKAILRS